MKPELRSVNSLTPELDMFMLAVGKGFVNDEKESFKHLSAYIFCWMSMHSFWPLLPWKIEHFT